MRERTREEREIHTLVIMSVRPSVRPAVIICLTSLIEFAGVWHYENYDMSQSVIIMRQSYIVRNDVPIF